jgi:hypothetical protein
LNEDELKKLFGKTEGGKKRRIEVRKERSDGGGGWGRDEGEGGNRGGTGGGGGKGGSKNELKLNLGQH